MAEVRRGEGRFVVAGETAVTLPSSATTEYGREINASLEVGADFSTNNRYVTFVIQASAVSGVNLDIGIYGAHEPSGTKYLLTDAPVADITDGTAAVAIIDLNASAPAPYLYVGWTSDADESANTISYWFFG